jgi:hypothetical protein
LLAKAITDLKPVFKVFFIRNSLLLKPCPDSLLAYINNKGKDKP